MIESCRIIYAILYLVINIAVLVNYSSTFFDSNCIGSLNATIDESFN